MFPNGESLQVKRAGCPPRCDGRIVEEQACAGLQYLDAALACHPDNAAIWVERGNIQLYRRRDLVLAAESFRRAAESPDAPYYAARIYAELLRRLGRDRDAYFWLRGIHSRLPADDEEAMSCIVLMRIRDLERKLGVPEADRYAPPVCPPTIGKRQSEID